MKCPKCNKSDEIEETIQLGSPLTNWYCHRCKIDFDKFGSQI